MNLVPYPVELKENEGSFSLEGAEGVFHADDFEAECISYKCGELGLSVDASGKHRFTLVIGTPEKEIEVPDRDEGYSLYCGKDGIMIKGKDLDGLFWGLTTLQQLCNGSSIVPGVTITDYPEFAFRGHHDDISRKQVSKVEDFKRIIRLLSGYKVNFYTPYIEDMVHLESFPEIGEGRGKLMPEEVAQILAEGRKHNVNIMPSYSLIGHQENMLADHRFEYLGKSVYQCLSSYDPDNNAVRRFLEKVIKDVCTVFNEGEYFNACFDETQGVEEQVLIDHANWCARELAKYGKKMLMWVDMFKNHYGLEKIKELDENIIPIEWQYGDPTGVEEDYKKAGIVPLGYPGYNNWCSFLPDFSKGKENIDLWAGLMRRWGGKGWFCSMWGDNGYENSRDLCWNLYAYNGEKAWRGDHETRDFEKRFDITFYGSDMETLRSDIKVMPVSRKISSGRSWKMFREPMEHLIRRLSVDSWIADDYEHDLILIEKGLSSLGACREQAVREKDHIDHFEVALLRERSIARRVLLAKRILDGFSDKELHVEVKEEIADLMHVRDRYREIWLRHNKQPNVEVSLAVYDRVKRSLEKLLEAEPPVDPGYHEVDLEDHVNAFIPDVAALPIFRERVHGIPFKFAPIDQTHCIVKPGETVKIPFEEKTLSDIHMICAGQTFENKEYTDFVKVTLLSEGKEVFSESLKNITHICCWWAPLGEHMWAGGGYRHADKKRNTYAFSPGGMHGVLRFSGFALGTGVKADTIMFEGVSEDELALFALTLEVKPESVYAPYSSRLQREVRLERMRPVQIDEAKKERAAVYTAFGSVEWHGRQNAVGLDTIKTHEMLVGLAQQAGGVVYPSIFLGAGGGHTEYPSSFMVSAESMIQVVGDLLKGWERDGYKQAVLVAGHYPNRGEYLYQAADDHKSSGGKMEILVVQESQLPGVEGDHAAREETSFQMFLNPSTVDLHQLDRDKSETYESDEKVNWMEDEYKDHPNFGIVGVDPYQHASAARGKRYAENFIKGIISWLEGEVTADQIRNWELRSE